MTSALGTAHVDIEIDVAEIGPVLQRAMRRAAERSGRDVERILARALRTATQTASRDVERILTRALRTAAQRAGDQMGRVITRALRSAAQTASRDMVRILSQAGARAGAGFAAAVEQTSADLPDVETPAGAAGDRAGRAFLGRFNAAISGLFARFAADGDAAGASFVGRFVNALRRLPGQVVGAIGNLPDRVGSLFDRLSARIGNTGFLAGRTFAQRFGAAAVSGIGVSMRGVLRVATGSLSGLGRVAAAAMDSATRGLGGRLSTNLSAAFRRADAEREGRSLASRFGTALLTGLGRTIGNVVRLGTRAVAGFSRAFASGFAGLLRIAPGIAAVGTALAALGPIMAGVGAGANALVLALGVLPAAGVAAAASLVTLKLAFDGVGTALEAGLAGDTEAYVEALKELTPAAQAAVRAGVGLRSQLDAIKATVQERFFAGLADDISRLGTTLLPALESGLGGLASALGEQFQSLLTSLPSATNLGALREIFADVSAAARNFAPAVGNLVTIFLQFTSSVTPFLAQMGTSISGLTERWAAFVTEAAQSGRITAFFEAAADRAGQFFDLLGQARPVVAGIADMLGPGLSAVFDQLSTAFANVGGPLIQFAGLIGQILLLIAPLIPPLTQLAGVILVALVQALTPLIGPLQHLISAILPPMIQFFTALGPALGDIAVVIGQVVVALTPLLPPLLDLATSLLPAFVAAAQALTPIIMALIPVIQFLVRALQELVLITQQVVAYLVNYFRQLGEEIASNITEIVNFVSGAWNAIRDTTISVFNGIRNFFSGLFGSIRSLFSNAWNGLRNIVSTGGQAIGASVSSLINDILGFFRGLPGRMVQIGKDIIQGLINGLAAAGQAVINFFRNLIGNAVDAVLGLLGISSPSKVFRRIGEHTGMGLVVGLQRMAPAVRRAAQQMAAAAVVPAPRVGLPGFGPAPRGPAGPGGLGGPGGFGGFGFGGWPPPAGRGGGRPVVAHSRSLTLNQTINVPATDPRTLAAVSGAHLRAAASKVLR